MNSGAQLAQISSGLGPRFLAPFAFDVSSKVDQDRDDNGLNRFGYL